MIGVDFNLDAISSATAVIPGAIRQIARAPRAKIVELIGVSVMKAITAKRKSELRVTAIAVCRYLDLSACAWLAKMNDSFSSTSLV